MTTQDDRTRESQVLQDLDFPVPASTPIQGSYRPLNSGLYVPCQDDETTPMRPSTTLPAGDVSGAVRVPAQLSPAVPAGAVTSGSKTPVSATMSNPSPTPAPTPVSTPFFIARHAEETADAPASTTNAGVGESSSGSTLQQLLAWWGRVQERRLERRRAQDREVQGWVLFPLGILLLTSGIAAFALSFQKIRPVVQAAGWSSDVAWMGPVMLDIAAVAAAFMAVASRHPEFRRTGRFLLITATGLSVIENLAGHQVTYERVPTAKGLPVLPKPWEWAATLFEIAVPVILAALIHVFGTALMAWRASRATKRGSNAIQSVPAPVSAARPTIDHPQKRPAERAADRAADTRSTTTGGHRVHGDHRRQPSVSVKVADRTPEQPPTKTAQATKAAKANNSAAAAAAADGRSPAAPRRADRQPTKTPATKRDRRAQDRRAQDKARRLAIAAAANATTAAEIRDALANHGEEVPSQTTLESYARELKKSHAHNTT